MSSHLINNKKMRARPWEDTMKRKSGLFHPLLIALLIGLLPATAIGGMRALNDSEMHDIYAEGFSEFTLVENGIETTMNLWLNINTAQYTTIETLKLGYHDGYNYKSPDPSFGWDHDWSNVSIGTGVEPKNNYITEGFYFKAVFENFDDSSLRQLKSVTWGVDRAEGQIHAEFDSFTGTIDNLPFHRANLGEGTIESRGGGGFEFTLSVAPSYYLGYRMDFEDSSFTPGPLVP
jgi:hypothetical protein